MTLSVDDISCSESLSQTLATSVLGMIHHERAENVAKFTVEMLNSGGMVQDLPELVLKIKVEPIQLLLHQKVLEFLRDYATKCQKELLERHVEKTEEKEEKKHDEEKKSPVVKPASNQRDLFVQKATISQFYVKFDYRSYKLTMSNLYKKEMLELLNIADIRDLVITFKKFEGRGFNTLDELIKCISQHYTNDILNNQLLTCVTGISLSELYITYSRVSNPINNEHCRRIRRHLSASYAILQETSQSLVRHHSRTGQLRLQSGHRD